jgi:hypothetical protein
LTHALPGEEGRRVVDLVGCLNAQTSDSGVGFLDELASARELEPQVGRQGQAGTRFSALVFRQIFPQVLKDFDRLSFLPGDRGFSLGSAFSAEGASLDG